MAVVFMENWDQYDTLLDAVARSYSQQAAPSFSNGSYLSAYIPRESVTTSGDGKAGGKALRVPLLQEYANLQNGVDNGNFYVNSGSGNFTLFDDPQATSETYIYSMWFKVSNLAADTVIMGVGNSTYMAFNIRLHTDGHLYFYPASTASGYTSLWVNSGADYDQRQLLNYFKSDLAGTSWGDSTGIGYTPVVADQWHFLEIKLELAAASATFEARIDGTTMLSRSDLDTSKSGLITSIDRIFHSNHVWSTDNGGTASPIEGDAGASTVGIVRDTLWDCIFIMDESGTSLNDFIGPSTIYSLAPDSTIANGDTGNTFVETGAASIAEALATLDGDTSYISAEAAADVTLGFDDLPVSNRQVHAVQVQSFAKATGVSPRTIQHKIGASEVAAGAAQSLDTSYASHVNIMESNPENAGSWEVNDVNSLEVKIETST